MSDSALPNVAVLDVLATDANTTQAQCTGERKTCPTSRFRVGLQGHGVGKRSQPATPRVITRVRERFDG